MGLIDKDGKPLTQCLSSVDEAKRIQFQIFRRNSVSGGGATLYIVPTNRTFYLEAFVLHGSTAGTVDGEVRLEHTNTAFGQEIEICGLSYNITAGGVTDVSNSSGVALAFPTPIPIPGGRVIRLTSPEISIFGDASIYGYEISTTLR